MHYNLGVVPQWQWNIDKEKKALPVCNICQGEVNLEKEGGIKGSVGILSFTFCVTCHAGVVDMVEQMCADCQNVGKVEMLEKNVNDLQGQLQAAYIKIKDLSALK